MVHAVQAGMAPVDNTILPLKTYRFRIVGKSHSYAKWVGDHSVGLCPSESCINTGGVETSITRTPFQYVTVDPVARVMRIDFPSGSRRDSAALIMDCSANSSGDCVTTLAAFKCNTNGPWDPACLDPVSPPIKFACVQQRWASSGFPKFASDLVWSGGFADQMLKETPDPPLTQSPNVFDPLECYDDPPHFVESSTIDGYKTGTWACDLFFIKHASSWKYSVFLNGPYAGLPVASNYSTNTWLANGWGSTSQNSLAAFQNFTVGVDTSTLLPSNMASLPQC